MLWLTYTARKGSAIKLQEKWKKFSLLLKLNLGEFIDRDDMR